MKADRKKQAAKKERVSVRSIPASNSRLTGILSVLRKNRITKGLTPQRLRCILEELGPTYVKLGQIMSMRSDLLPEKYCTELMKLRTSASGMPYETVIQVVEEELKCPYQKIFSGIDKEPLGSASIAQVHRAHLQGGEAVVIKVQRPHIKEIMAEDIALMRKAAGILKLAMGTGELIDFRTIIEELWKISREEMDFLKEAGNLELFYENQKQIVYTSCPKVYREYTTARLLVMSCVDGIQIDCTNRLEEAGYDREEIGQKAAENYCKQILEDGFFHGDPHPGNLWILGGQIVWLDWGMAGHLSENYRYLLRKAIIAMLSNDIYELKNVFLAFGEPKGKINHARLYTDMDEMVARYMNMDFCSLDMGELAQSMIRLLKSHNIAVNADITLLGRSMVTMEGTLKACSPKVSLMEILSNHMSSAILEELDWKKELRHNGRLIFSSMRKSLEIPALVADLLHITKNGQTKLNLEFSDGKELRDDFYRLGNRFALVLLIGAMLISSSLLCQTSIRPLVWGMPWPGFAGFLFTAVLFLILLLNLLHKKR